MTSSTSTTTGGAGQRATSDAPRGGVTRHPDFDACIEAIERAESPHDLTDMDIAWKKRSSLAHQGYRTPGFGEPLPDCTDCIPESRHFCTDCGALHPIPRNCFRYDCPDHAAQAIRRRAAGIDGADNAQGIVAQLDALARRLGSYYGVRFNFYHLVISPPDDYAFESDEPLRRAVGIGDHDGIIPEIMDALGIQGPVAAHAHRGDNEDHDSGDMGEWRERLPPWSGTDRDWHDDVRQELTNEPHFHIVGVAPWEPGDGTLEGWADVYEETGWVLNAIEGRDGSTVIGSNANRPVEKTQAVARAVTYTLSHALVYNAGEQRRLGAWMKGPDVDTTTVLEKNHRRIKRIVNQVAADTLGILPPSLECDNEVRREIHLGHPGDNELPELDRPSAHRDPLDPAYHEPIGGWSGPNIASRTPGTPSPISPTSGGGPADGVAGMSARPTELPEARAASSSSAGSGSRDTPADTAPVTGDDTDDGLQECGGHLEHISHAGTYLARPDWVAQAPESQELDRYYCAYQRLMQQKGLDLEDGRTEIPEYQDSPPPD